MRRVKGADPDCKECGGTGLVEIDPTHGDDQGSTTTCICVADYEEADFSGATEGDR